MISTASSPRERLSRLGRFMAALGAAYCGVMASCEATPFSATNAVVTEDDTELAVGDGNIVHVRGPEGGPFPQGSREYWLENTTPYAVLQWSVVETTPWLDLSATEGVLHPGDRTSVVARIDQAVAVALPSGQYETTIAFRDLRSGGSGFFLRFVLTVTPGSGADLAVTPAEDFVSSGPVGGPVTPASKVYSLENEGTLPLDWLVAADQPWISFTGGTSGTLQPQERVDVRVRIDGTHASLGAGEHQAIVEFENQSSGSGSTARTVRLTLTGGGGRVEDGLQALYDFEQGSGTTIPDVAGVGGPLDLVIEDPSKVTWQPGSLRFVSPTRAKSPGSAQRIANALEATNEITLEAWITPANLTQDGPARIVTMSDGAYLRNVTLGQGLWDSQPRDTYNTRLRTTQSDLDGMPLLTTGAGVAKTSLQHVVFTRAASGATRIYVDGVQQAAGQLGGTFANWDASYLFCLGNEIGASRPWLGSMHLVAVYDRALSAVEVQQNRAAGTGDGEMGYLSVSPSSDWSITGEEGSDFDQQSKVYTLSNPGTEAIDWRIVLGEPWIGVAGDTIGSLAPGESENARITLDGGQASGFAPGVYRADVSFRNLTNGLGTTAVEVILNVTSPGGGGEKPGPHNTGPYDESILAPSSSINVTQNGALIENKAVSGGITVSANNVTIRNCRIDGGYYGILVGSGTTGTVIEDCEILNSDSAGIYGASGNWSAYRLNIHDTNADGVKMRSNTRLEASWIHHLGKAAGSHADGNQTRGGSNIYMIGNNFDMPVPESPNGPGPPYKSNAAAMNDTGIGDIHNLVMDGNWVNGGNFTIYLRADQSDKKVTASRIINNRFGRDYRYGVLNLNGNVEVEVSGNVWDDTGELMDIND